MRSRCMLYAFVLLALPTFSAAAWADTFTLNTVLQGGTLTGTISINTQTGVVFDTNLLFNIATSRSTYQASFTGPMILSPIGRSTTVVNLFNQNMNTDALTLSLPGANLIGYSGGPVCSLDMLCTALPNFQVYSSVRFIPQGSYIVDSFQSGSLTPTPEPGTLGLLGTGVLGLAGVMRRSRVWPSSRTASRG